MTTITLPADLKTWADAQVAAGRADSVEALATAALAEAKRQQERIAGKLADARAQADRDGWIDGDDALTELRAWIAENEAEEARLPPP
jgi:hypothetical protein